MDGKRIREKGGKDVNVSKGQRKGRNEVRDEDKIGIIWRRISTGLFNQYELKTLWTTAGKGLINNTASDSSIRLLQRSGNYLVFEF
jgi:hypothetical protein